MILFTIKLGDAWPRESPKSRKLEWKVAADTRKRCLYDSGAMRSGWTEVISIKEHLELANDTWETEAGGSS